MSNSCPKDGPETAWQRSAERKKEGRSTWGFGGLLAVVVIGAAVSGCGSDDKSDKSDGADPAASAPASPSAKESEEAPAATTAADPAPTQKAEPTTVLTLTGSGTKDTKAFKVGDEWTLSYTFDCTKAMAAVGGKGNFIVFDKEDKLVNEMDKTGKSSSTQHTSGNRRLQIISECDWTVKVTT
ncbi:hypothetical protein [Streptomyces cyslabdanicus]|uniref:hypothetical protein n=1 Tax=Streptomyces cyslabdanicus TaxID=1470456 RepID=UPI00404503FD